MMMGRQHPDPVLRRNKVTAGFSLVEVLLIISMLSLIMVPYTLVMSQTTQGSRGLYLQSTRSILLNSLLDEMDPERTTYYFRFNDSSMDTTVSESGQTIPIMRKVDVTNSGATDSLKRTVNFYLYNNSTDANTAYRYKTRVVQSVRNLRQRTGTGVSMIDTANNLWQNTATTYDSATKVPGLVASYSYDATACPDIINTTGNDDNLLCKNSFGASISYSADVENGPYTVKLYFAEINSSINGTTNRRLADITIEGVQMTQAPYSPYEATGGTGRAHVKMYDVNVSDGTLNITISKNASSNDSNVFVNAIQILKWGA